MRALIAVVVILFGGSELFVAAQRVGFAQRSGTTRQTGQEPVVVDDGSGSAPPGVRHQLAPIRKTGSKSGGKRLQKLYGNQAQGAQAGSGTAPGAGSSADELRAPNGGSSRPGKGNGGVKLAFTDMPVDRVVNAVMTELGYSYVIDPAVSGTVSLFTMDDIPKKTLFRVLEQVLKLAGQAIVKQEGIYVVLPIGKSPRVPHKILARPPSSGASQAVPAPVQEKPGCPGGRPRDRAFRAGIPRIRALRRGRGDARVSGEKPHPRKWWLSPKRREPLPRPHLLKRVERRPRSRRRLPGPLPAPRS